MGPFLPVDRPGPGGLKGRGTLDEPGRSRRCAPRARESDALPVTQAEREPTAPSGSRRRAPTTARDRRSLGPLRAGNGPEGVHSRVLLGDSQPPDRRRRRSQSPAQRRQSDARRSHSNGGAQLNGVFISFGCVTDYYEPAPVLQLNW